MGRILLLKNGIQKWIKSEQYEANKSLYGRTGYRKATIEETAEYLAGQGYEAEKVEPPKKVLEKADLPKEELEKTPTKDTKPKTEKKKTTTK